MSGAQNYTATQHSNQGIVDGRPAGRQPSPQPVTLNTVVDPDASGQSVPTPELPDVTSKDLRHGGQPGRKEGLRLEARWGPGGQ
ncbi:uncharacterized protein BT62DRAFT_1078260 [Guyanagaster necrorhizus]|uniref:Uncharacterized protein n=1 Tax=Guyanagaster necrorhizus TaxID=856835 RepID=A0A9P8AQ69_9AGAR|nr:uncharacterized protein BT62DRAFT_1078260 [Guyanagaster necrorhizus MCA 3950]KAG7443779.1 hypothetical protein BT62DRAFT_1078260 [Guyanagaster necrorhizus MCA 3950]